MKIRKFKKQDAKRVCDIIKENNTFLTSKFYPKRIINYWNEKLNSEKLILKRIAQRKRYVIEEKKKVVGYICFEKNVLKMLFIDIKYHNKGFGTALVKKAEDQIKKDKHLKIIAKPNINIEGFFRSLNYKRVKVIYKNTGRIKVKKILMKKPLK